MQEFSRLFANGLDQARVAVTERTHGDTGAEIQVAFPRLIPKAAAVSAHGDKRKPPVGGKNVLLEEFGGAHWEGGP
jgi:hypothetical protein